MKDRGVKFSLLFAIVLQWILFLYYSNVHTNLVAINEVACAFDGGPTFADPHHLYAEDERSLWSNDEMHIRSCFHEEGNIVCLITINKNLVKQSPVAYCPNGNPGIFVPLNSNEQRGHDKPWLLHTFSKIICPCNEPSCPEYQPSIEKQVFPLRSNTNRLWQGPFYQIEAPQEYKYKICTVSAVLRHKPTALDLWLKHYYEAEVDHMFTYTSQFHIPTLLYNTLKDQGLIEEVAWPGHYSLHQSDELGKDLAYIDALYRFRGQCEWTLFIDTEDYFWQPDIKYHHIPTVLDEFFNNQNITIHTFLLPTFSIYPSCGIDVFPLASERNHSSSDTTMNVIMTKTLKLTDIQNKDTIGPNVKREGFAMSLRYDFSTKGCAEMLHKSG